MFSITDKAYNLLHQGIITLGQIERNGVRIDVDYCEKQCKRLSKKIKILDEVLQEHKEVRLWKKVYGKGVNYNSDLQLRNILFKKLKYSSSKKTKTEQESVDQEELERIMRQGADFLKEILERRKAEKIKATLEEVLRETTDNYLHAFIDLHTARSYRSSSSRPNQQNKDKRDKVAKRIVRKAFIPREGHRFLEIDLKGNEVGNAACYHKDPNMISYLKDPTKDMHRDMAAQCFKLKKKQVTKHIRYMGKNMVVFPWFYGDYHRNSATNMWEEVHIRDILTKDDINLLSHMEDQGIGEYDNFESHLRRVEKHFWGKRFKVYGEWKEEWYAKYLEKGYFDSLTGFRYKGMFDKNQVINYPVQGAAFHCLLWALIKIQQIALMENWKTRIVNQIHDSILFDVHPSEYSRVVEVCRKVFCEDLPKEWDWIIVPIGIEAEVGEVDGSWYRMKEVPIQ